MNAKIVLTLLVLMILTGCSETQSDLEVYIDQVKKRAPGRVEPLPTFAPYETFVYAASGERSPFEPPVTAEQLLAGLNVSESAVQPPANHIAQPLERFSMSDLTMIGHIELGDSLWGLIQDDSGSVHRVELGDLMGKNYGRVFSITSNSIELIEIVPNGPGSWIERPRTMTLSGRD